MPGRHIQVDANKLQGFGISPFAVAVTFRSGQIRQQFRLSGTTFDPIRATSPVIAFSGVVRLQEKAITNVATLVVAPEVGDVAITVPPENEVFERTDTLVHGQRQITFRVATSPVQDVNRINVPVTISGDLTSGNLAELRINCVGQVECDVRYSPTVLLISGMMDGGALKQQGIKFWSASGSKLEQIEVIAQSLKLDALVEDEADGTSVSVQLRGQTNERPPMQCGTVLITGWSPHDRSRFTVKIPTTVTIQQNSVQLDNATLPKTVSDTTGG